MKLQGQVYKYGDTVYFTLTDVLQGRLEDDILYVLSDKGEVPVIYESVRKVRPEWYMIHPRACATCHHLRIDDDGWRCQLPDGPRYVDLQQAYWHKCDGWRARVLADKEGMQ